MDFEQELAYMKAKNPEFYGYVVALLNGTLDYTKRADEFLASGVVTLGDRFAEDGDEVRHKLLHEFVARFETLKAKLARAEAEIEALNRNIH